MITPRFNIESNLEFDGKSIRYPAERGFVFEPEAIVISVASTYSPRLIANAVISLPVLINLIFVVPHRWLIPVKIH